ncbi:hypothetical protein DC366_11710 [Pelagivirga sediminicola]|uniref:Uncharacterized protein n=1 Tax=Pelagivirga sediminicola TaxID=2170575 RepID=A0A2T7G5S6_9RHOB|nr:hypothetical protein [Pelagivirga sediminicola]PVA09782.1 hypothetical protein DC366_11710 [Pelagivirga sediminicola]
MIKLTPALTAIALVFATPTLAADTEVLPAKGDEISKYRDAGAWTIRENATRGSCFASYQSESGAIVQFGFTKDEQAGYLGLFSQLAEDVAPKQEIAVLANGNLYVGEATGVGASLADGYEGGYILVNNPEFVKDIELGKELVAFPETPESYIVDMSGAKNAVYEVRKCTNELKAK